MKLIDTFMIFGADGIDPDETIINIPGRLIDETVPGRAGMDATRRAETDDEMKQGQVLPVEDAARTR